MSDIKPNSPEQMILELDMHGGGYVTGEASPQQAELVNRYVGLWKEAEAFMRIPPQSLDLAMERIQTMGLTTQVEAVTAMRNDEVYLYLEDAVAFAQDGRRNYMEFFLARALEEAKLRGRSVPQTLVAAVRAEYRPPEPGSGPIVEYRRRPKGVVPKENVKIGPGISKREVRAQVMETLIEQAQHGYNTEWEQLGLFEDDDQPSQFETVADYFARIGLMPPQPEHETISFISPDNGPEEFFNTDALQEMIGNLKTLALMECGALRAGDFRDQTVLREAMEELGVLETHNNPSCVESGGLTGVAGVVRETLFIQPSDRKHPQMDFGVGHVRWAKDRSHELGVFFTADVSMLDDSLVRSGAHNAGHTVMITEDGPRQLTLFDLCEMRSGIYNDREGPDESVPAESQALFDRLLKMLEKG